MDSYFVQKWLLNLSCLNLKYLNEKCYLQTQLFVLLFWRHPFTAEDPLVSKWCNVMLTFSSKTNSSTSWIVWRWIHFKIFLGGGETCLYGSQCVDDSISTLKKKSNDKYVEYLWNNNGMFWTVHFFLQIKSNVKMECFEQCIYSSYLLQQQQQQQQKTLGFIAGKSPE